MDELILRNIKIDDIPYVVDIQIDGWKTAYKGIIQEQYLNEIDRNKKIEKRQKDFKNENYIIAELNKSIVGFCRYVDNNSFSPYFKDIDCEIVAIYVRTDLKNNGIGTKMFKEAIKRLKENSNRKKMVLWCLKKNLNSRRFYEKMGGKVVSEKKVKIGDDEYSEVAYLFNI